MEVCNDAFHPSENQTLPEGISKNGVSESFSTATPISLYGSTKLASEMLALEYGETFNLQVWINRCGVLAGAGQFGRPDQGIFAFWINSWLRRKPLSYIGFGGNGYQVRDCLHPMDLVPVIKKQIATTSAQERVINLGGGIENSMSLAQLSAWCRDRYGDHTVSQIHEIRRFDIPWLVMDSAKAESIWGFSPETSLNAVLEEIANHAENHPEWLELSGL